MEFLVRFVIAVAIAYLTRARPPKPKPASLSDFDIPTAEQGRPIPVVFGKVTITGPNCVWYGDLRSVAIEESGGLFGDDQIVGYKYYLGLHMVLSYPVDALLKFSVDGRVAWSGTANDTSISVNKPNLFGGESKGGGFSGTIDILEGASDQARNSYLTGRLGADISAFRGVTSVVHRQNYIGNSPFIKPFAYTVLRVNKLTTLNTQWYAAKSDINDSLNPAHIIRECITDLEWGMGYPAATVDDAEFTAAADTLYTESFGLSFLWVQQSSVEDFIQQVADHINAKVYVSPVTGLWTIKLLRHDYDVNTIPSLDPSNVVRLDSYARMALGETVNEIVVTYRDSDDNNDKTITAQNIGNIQMQGSVVSQAIAYPGIPNGTLAAIVAERDVIARSTALAKVKLSVNRSGWSLALGDVFKLSWPELGVVEQVFRVGEIDYGTLTEGTIEVLAIEDVFGMPTSSFTQPQPTGWTDPTNPPVDVPYRNLFEAPYWDIQKKMSASELSAVQQDFGFTFISAAAPTGDSYGYQIHSKLSGGSYAKNGYGTFSPTATLNAAVSVTDTTIAFENEVDLDEVVINDHAYIGTEMVEVLTLSTINNEMTVKRGILDTVPQAHTSGTRIWFSGQHQGIDKVERTDADVVDVKLLPETTQGALDIGSATAEQITISNRYERPYPPGDFQINASAYPATVQDTIDVTWAHRDRTQQLDSFTAQNAANIGPETDVTYSINIKDSGDNIIDSATGLTGTSHSYVPTFDADTVTVELWSVRNSLDSWQMQTHTFTYSSAYVPSFDFSFDSDGYTPSNHFNFDLPQ